MVDPNTIEVARTNQFEVPVQGTLGYLHQIRNDRGYYEAKVAALNPPLKQKNRQVVYLLGGEKDQEGNPIARGAWIRFADRAEDIVSRWQPSIGDRVLVITLGQYGWESGWIFRIATSYDQDAQQAEDFEINGPTSIFSGKGGVL